MDHHATPLIAFYRGEASDHKGRRIDELWGLSPFWLEHTHDYIQWLFPIPEAGRFNGFAPTLSGEDRQAFADDATLRARQQTSLDVMLSFFGLERESETITATPSLNMREHIWLKAGGHNHLRISRMIRSLAYCHQPALAASLQRAVTHIGQAQGSVSEVSIRYWSEASR